MSVLDFLFEGKPPKSVTTYGQTIENVPKWMSDYTQGLISRANAAAAEPYIPYGGPRLAGFTPAQEAAFQLTEQNVGAYKPYLEGATAGTVDVLGGPSPLEEASPYLEGATKSFADPGMAEQYINPYIENVLKRQESMAGRTLEEKFLPKLQRTFAGAGQYGSRGGFGSMEDIGVRGVRDIQEGLEEQRLATLGTAYGQAADIFGAERGRELQAGEMTGRLGTAGRELGLRGAEQLGGLGEATQRMGLTDVAALEGVGATQRGLDQASLDLAYKDFMEQRDLPFERLGFMSDVIRGLPHSRAVQSTDVGPAQAYQPSPLSQAVGAYGTYRGLTGNARGGLARYAGGGPVIDISPEDYEVIEMMDVQ